MSLVVFIKHKNILLLMLPSRASARPASSGLVPLGSFFVSPLGASFLLSCCPLTGARLVVVSVFRVPRGLTAVSSWLELQLPPGTWQSRCTQVGAQWLALWWVLLLLLGDAAQRARPAFMG